MDQVQSADLAVANVIAGTIGTTGNRNATQRLRDLELVADELRRELDRSMRRLQSVLAELEPGGGRVEALPLRPSAAPHAAGAPRACPLGARERQVLRLIADGERTPRVAEHLGISVATVEAHRRNIMRKLDLHSVAELTKYALREGLTSL
jgi:DNA-binding NarL/FixJ family response regulator